tara:strand:+ start:29233 stop:30090 length:858 start_codon:yes stop_codon:yes gene_type:complete
MMLTLKNLIIYKKKYLVAIFSVFFISCSSLGQWWYDRLDIYLANYFFEYADFSNQQKSYIRSITKDYLAWNSTTEVPKYKNLIIKIRSLDEGTTILDIENIFEEGESLFRASNDFFSPHIVNFCKTITDKQVEEIDLFFKERISKWEESAKKSEDKSPEERTVDSVIGIAKFLGVKLNKVQLKEIKRLSKKSERPEYSSIKIQSNWNNKMISILKDRGSEDFDTALSDHLESLLNEEGRNDQETLFNEIIATTIASLTTNQKKKFNRRLNVFISSLDKIIKSHKQ